MEERLASRAESDGAAGQWQFRTGAKALVTSSDRVLLVAEEHADGSPFWTFPGGGVRPDESLVGGLRREVSEELRWQALVSSPLTRVCYAHTTLHGTFSVYTVFDCTLLSDPAPARSEGIVDVSWVEPSDLPDRTLPYVRQIVDERVDC